MTSTNDFDAAAAHARRNVKHSRGALDTQELIRFSTLAASSHNTQPWKFRVQQQSIAILPDFTRRCPVVDPDDAHLFKSLGCAAENMVHSAAAQGFHADVIFDPAEDAVIIRFEPSPTAAAGPLFDAITTRQCTKAPYDGHPLKSDELKLLERAGAGAGVRTLLLTSRQQLDLVIGYVTRGNHEQLNDPAFRQELLEWVRFNPAEALRTGDGLAGRVNGQPALPRWAGKHILPLVLTAGSQAATDAKNIRSSAAVAVFLAQNDDKPAWVEIGRAYERFALQATALGIRHAFINQPVEVRPLRLQFENALGVAGEQHTLLMVRIGRAPLAPFSLRRRLDEVVDR